MHLQPAEIIHANVAPSVVQMARPVPDDLSKADKNFCPFISQVFHPGQVLPSNVAFTSDGAKLVQIVSLVPKVACNNLPRFLNVDPLKEVDPMVSCLGYLIRNPFRMGCTIWGMNRESCSVNFP